MNNKREFEKFYQKHFDKVYRFVFFRCSGNKEVTEDLISEIFMKALEHFADYDPKISASAWLMTITKNHLKNYWRDAKPTVALPGEAGDEEEEGDAKWLKTAMLTWQKQADKACVLELMSGLDSEIDKEIVTFHYLFGYSYNEIAEMRGMSEGAVKVAAHRAIAKLRELL